MDQPKTWAQDALIPPESDGHFVMIPLTQGKFAIVDEVDAGIVLSRGKWHAIKAPNTFYAARAEGPPGTPNRRVAMHVLISGCKGADHANRNGLDNRRVNLRQASASQNTANKPPLSTNKSGYKGVHRNSSGSWIAQISVRGEKIYLGSFRDLADAVRAYNRAAVEAFGEFAWLNPIPPPRPEPIQSPEPVLLRDPAPLSQPVPLPKASVASMPPAPVVQVLEADPEPGVLEVLHALAERYRSPAGAEPDLSCLPADSWVGMSLRLPRRPAA